MGIGEGIGGVVGGIAGGIAAGDERGHEQALIDEAIAAINGVKLPTNLADNIYFHDYQNAGQLTPEQEQSILAGPSAEGQVKANPELVKAQMQALNTLKGLSQTGMSSTDRARLNQIQQQINTQAEGQRQGIMQNFAQRGQAGSGNELLAQLTASQNAANSANDQGLNVAANAQQNALSALGQYGGAAGQMNQQQFGQDVQTSQAQDMLNRFNTQNQLAQQAHNVGSRNAAQQFNLQNKQNIMGQNTGLYNQNLMLQRQGEQQMFQNAMQKAGALAGAQFKGSDAYGKIGDKIAEQWNTTGKGIGGLAGEAFGGGPTPSTVGTQSLNGAGQLRNMATGGHGMATAGGAADMNEAGGYGSFYAAHGGEVENCYSNGGHTYLTPAMSQALMRHGGHVPGQAKVEGDSYSNDTVHAVLSPMEIVIPRSIVQSPRAGELAKHFVEGEIEKHSKNRVE